MTNTDELAEFVLTTNFEDLSDEVIEETKKRILDAISIAAGATDAEPVKILRKTIDELDHDGTTSIWASNLTTSPPLATAINGAMVRYLDFMDAYLVPNEVPHPSNNVAPAIVSAEYNNATGKDLITALALAYEIHYQLGKNAPLMDRGWDHGTYVAFTSAAVSGYMFDLDHEQLRNSFGIAGAGHNALRVTRTGEISMWKGLSASNSARNGIYSVMLANNGMEGPKDIFEGKKGWKDVVSGPFTLEYTGCEAVTQTMTKKYMAGTVAQSALDAFGEILERESIDLASINSIEVDTYGRAKKIMGGTGKQGEAGDRYNVTTREEADHSLPYTLAVLAIDGELSHAQYNPIRIRQDDVQNLLHRVTISEDPHLTNRYEDGEMPARVRVSLNNGTTHEIEKRYFEGHPEQPMSWNVLREKFSSLAEETYSREEQKMIIEIIQNLEERDVSELITTLTSE